MSALLSANEIRLTYGYQTLLDGVTLAIAAGEKIGMVGRNGCGKTSLLKILTGQQAADSGEIALRRALRIGYLPQEFELDAGLSVQENIAAGAADIVEAVRRYENGEGSEAELADLLHLIDHADGWNLDARIKATATALDAPPLDADGRPAIRWGKTPGRAVPRAGLPAGSAVARRADQPSRRRVDPLAGGLSARAFPAR